MIASEYDELDRELGDLADERAARKRAGGVRMLPIMVGVVSLFALGGIVWYAYTQGVREGSEVAAPLLRPDSPAKETPDDPGGRQIAGAELGVYDVVNGADGATRPSVERILPEPEEPQSLPTRAPQPVPEAQAPAAPAPPPVDSGGQTEAAPAQRQPIPEPGAQQAAPLPDASLAAPSAPPPTAGTETQDVSAAAEAPPEPPAPPPAPAPEPAQTAAAPAGDAGNGWRIQIAALKSDADARAQWTKVQSANRDLLGDLALQVQKATVNGTDYFRVRGGPISSGDAAKALCVQLKAKGVACIPVAPGK
ncbi:MAG: SPOR domain-containing protein [Pseudomonadota bacterium]|nr:SPOR domain-containing protein [Pseudomonadota bacterium]